MDKADDCADGSGIKPDNEANLLTMIELSKQIYTELAVQNIIDEVVETNFGNKPNPHVPTSLEDELEPHVPTSLEDEPEPHVPTSLEDEPEPYIPTSLEDEPDHHAPKSLEEELEAHGPKILEEELEPQGPISLGEELEPKSLCEELNPKSLRVELSGPTSQPLEYLFIYPKADDNSKTVTSESFEPNTSDLLEQTDARPEQIIKEELEHIFEHTFDSVAQKVDENSKTDLQQSGDNSGGSFQDLELSEIWHNKNFFVDEEPRVMSSAEFYTTPGQSSPLETSQTVLFTTPLDEFTLLDKLDVSGEIKVGSSEEVISLGPQLLRVIENRSNWDIMIFVGNYKFRCHMLALQMYSPYFRRFKSCQTYAIRLPSKWVTAQAFKVIYDWIMQKQCIKMMSFSNRSILEIYSAAQFLGITELVNVVCHSFDMMTDEDEIYSLLPDVFHLGIPTFEQLFLSRISRFFLTLVASQEFVELKARHVKQLLASQKIGVNSEIEVVYAAVRWLNHEWPQRRVHVPDMMSSVRFSLLPPMFLRFLQKPQKTRVLHEISKCPLVIEEINKAFVYTSSTLLYKGPHAVLEFQLPPFEVPEHRKWLYDPKCAHHRNIMCDMRQFFTYAQFLQYLETLHNSEPDHWKTLEYLEKEQSCTC